MANQKYAKMTTKLKTNELYFLRWLLLSNNSLHEKLLAASADGSGLNEIHRNYLDTKIIQNNVYFLDMNIKAK